MLQVDSLLARTLQVDSLVAIRADSLLAAVQAAGQRRPESLRDLLDLPLLVAIGLKVAAAVAVTVLAFGALKLVLRRIERSFARQPGAALTAQEQRARTMVGLFRSIGRVVIGIMFLFMVLGAVGFELGPLLAGAGVVGLAISFGSQSLVKDVIAGLFILIENQFAVGDVIRIEGVSGAVEEMTLRVVVLRDVEGVVHIVPNGQITKVSNLTRTWSRVVLDVGVAYREDPDRVMAVLREVGRGLWDDPEWRPLLVEPVEVPGVESFGESAVNVRVWAKTLPLKQWDVARELRRRIKLRFDAEGIEIPFPHQTVYWREGSAPPRVPALSGARGDADPDTDADDADGGDADSSSSGGGFGTDGDE